jgi:serine/threonine protein kinase
MAIRAGQKLSHYELAEQIGEGGMGVVWRGRDTKLDRDVAIKILPDAFSRDPDRLARFEREAKLLASLNHANIATVHGFEHDSGLHFLAMELVDGEDLAIRIGRGAIPIEEALPLALQIASALETAHERGVIHRDLKPANIKVTPEGTVKVLDFGLAKAFGPDAQDPMTSPTMSPTVTSAGNTAIGVILGTAAYMSPEQAKGKPVDRRADIWSFGVVLLEMLTGRQAFHRESVSETIAAVLTAEPDLSALLANTPPKVRRLLERCLRKEPQSRLRDIGDARVVVEEALAGREWENVTQVQKATAGRRVIFRWVLVGALTVLAGLFGLRLLQPAPRSAPEFFSIVSPIPPDNISFTVPQPRLSHDGSSFAFVATNEEGVNMLWVRSFGSPTSRELPGTEGASAPFWSPDGRSIGFFRDLGMHRVDLTDGAVRRIAGSLAAGATWNADDRVLFSASAWSGTHEVSASGGRASPVAQTESVGGFQLWPHFLPDGNHFLFFGGPDYYSARLHLGSLDPPVVRPVGDIRSRAEYVNGYLLFGDGDTLLAQRFDVESAKLLGQPVTLVRGVGMNPGSRFNYAFSASDDVLVYSVGYIWPEHRLVSLDRQGSRLETNIPPGLIVSLDLSPDGETLVFGQADPATYKGSVWTVDLATGIPTIFMSEPNDDIGCPQWSPDGSRILATDWNHYFIKDVVTGETEKFPCGQACNGWPADWSADGKRIVIRTNSESNGADLWVLPLNDAGSATPLLATPANEASANVSRDGRWIAYASDESGSSEVYVQSFPELGRKVRVSADGGSSPLWREDGGELYYLDFEDRALMAATVSRDGSGLTISPPQKLFRLPLFAHDTTRRQYAVLDNGKRFLFPEADGNLTPRPIHVVRDWQSLLEER